MTIRTPFRRRDILLVAGGALAAAGTRRARADTGPAGGATLTLGWRDVSPSGLVVLAAADGRFADARLAVRLVRQGLHGPRCDDLLRTGAVDACVAPIPSMLGPLVSGLDARFTAGLCGSGVRLLADRHAHFRRIEDVNHRRVGVADLSGSARLLVSLMLRRKGIDPLVEIDWIELPPDGFERAIRTGVVDAVALHDPDAYALARRLDLTEIANGTTAPYGSRPFAGLLVSGSLLRRAPEAAASLTTALEAAARDIATHPHEAASLAARLPPGGMSPRMLRAMLSSEALGAQSAGDALVADIAASLDELRLLGTVPFDLHSGAVARGLVRTLPRS